MISRDGFRERGRQTDSERANLDNKLLICFLELIATIEQIKTHVKASVPLTEAQIAQLRI